MRFQVRVIALVALLFTAIGANAGGFDYRYDVRNGDLNGDGLFDFHFSHRPKIAMVPVDDLPIPIPISKTVLKKFVLLRQANGTFTLTTSLTASEQALVQSWKAVRVGLGNGDFNGDGELDLQVLSLPSNINPRDFRDVAVLAPSSTSTLQAVDGLIARRYYVLAGDINADGKTDLFITGNASRFVPDFLLTQNTAWDFTVVSQPTAAQLLVARSWPVVDLPVYREDHNFDGYYDFYIEQVRKVITDAEDIIVYTYVNSGQRPRAAISLDDPGATLSRPNNKWFATYRDLSWILNGPRCATSCSEATHFGDRDGSMSSTS